MRDTEDLSIKKIKNRQFIKVIHKVICVYVYAKEALSTWNNKMMHI